MPHEISEEVRGDIKIKGWGSHSHLTIIRLNEQKFGTKDGKVKERKSEEK